MIGKMWPQLVSFRSASHGGASVAVMAPLACCRCCCQRWLHLTAAGQRAKKPGFFDRFVAIDPADLNKRPSDLEIKKKDLPKNQPTLAERLGKTRGGAAAHTHEQCCGSEPFGRIRIRSHRPDTTKKCRTTKNKSKKLNRFLLLKN